MSDEINNGNAAGGRSDTPALQPTNTAQLRQDVARRAKLLGESAAELEQAALFDEPEFEEALLLEPEEITKRYTAENSKQIIWRQDACVKLLARQCPARDIADILHMNLRTISAIAAQNGVRIAKFSEGFAEILLSSAASDIAFAQTKRDEAGYKDLHIGAGIKLTHAQSLRSLGMGAPENATDVESESDRRVAFKEKLKQLENGNGQQPINA